MAVVGQDENGLDAGTSAAVGEEPVRDSDVTRRALILPTATLGLPANRNWMGGIRTEIENSAPAAEQLALPVGQLPARAVIFHIYPVKGITWYQTHTD